MKDPFASERAMVQSKKNDPKMGDFFEHLLAGLKGDLEPMIKANKGADGKTPIKGKDYFTEKEINALKAEIIKTIPKGDKGDTPSVDYDLLFAYCAEQVAKIPKPKDGDDGEDAVIDTAYVISEVLKQVPKIETPTVNYKEIEDFIDGKIRALPPTEKRVVGYSSLGRLTDVILTGVPQDSKGNYILTPGGSGGGHTIEDEGTPLTQRSTLNFVGAGVTVTDVGAKTTVTIPGGSGSGITRSVSNIAINTTAGATASTDYEYNCTAALTLTLPTAVGNTNRYTVTRIAGLTTVATTAAQTINGSATATLTINNMSLDFVSDGANWNVK